MKLGNQEEYNIRMSLPQMYVILVICKAGTISAKDISKALNIQLSKLAPIFNSLIESEIVIRGKGVPNDPNILFSINWEKSFPNKDCSIVQIIKKYQQMKENKQRDVNSPNLTVLRAKMMASVMNNKYTFSELKTELEKQMGVPLQEGILKEELQRAIAGNNIMLDGDHYCYNKVEKNLIVDSDEDEEELYDETDPKVDPKVDPEVDPKVDPKIDPKVEIMAQMKENFKNLAVFDDSPKGEPKVEPKANPKVADKEIPEPNPLLHAYKECR